MDLGLVAELFAVLLGCFAGLFAGVMGMAALYIVTGRAKWVHYRRQFRPWLWHLGLDWPEVKRTWKRAFMIYYARGLPDSEQLEQQPELSDAGLLDESGDVPPGNSQPAKSPTATP
jgi:hypothetical protein